MAQGIDDVSPRNEQGLGNTGTPQDPTPGFQDVIEAQKNGTFDLVKAQDTEASTVPEAQKVNQDVLDALSKTQDETKLVDDDVDVRNISDLKETLNERLNRISDSFSMGSLGDEKLERSDWYPSYDKGVVQGQISDPFIGTTPLISGDGVLFPMAVLQSRQKALKEAAKERAAVRKKVRQLFSKHAPNQYDGDYQDLNMELMNEYGEKVNWNFEDLADGNNEIGREFFAKYNKLQVVRNDLIAADSLLEQMKKDFKNPEVYVPPSVLEGMNKIADGKANIREMFESKAAEKKFNEGIRKVKSYENTTVVIDKATGGANGIQHQVAASLERSVEEMIAGGNEEAKQDMLTWKASKDVQGTMTFINKYVDKGAVEKVVETTLKNSNTEYIDADGDRQTEMIKEYSEYVYNKIGQEVKSKVDLNRTVFPDGKSSSGSTDKLEGSLFTNWQLADNKRKEEPPVGNSPEVSQLYVQSTKAFKAYEAARQDANTPQATLDKLLEDSNKAREKYTQTYMTSLGKKFNITLKEDQYGRLSGDTNLLTETSTGRRLSIGSSKFSIGKGRYVGAQGYLEVMSKKTAGFTKLTNADGDSLLSQAETNTLAAIKGLTVTEFEDAVTNKTYNDKTINNDDNAIEKVSGVGMLTRTEMFFKMQDEQGNWKEVDAIDVNPRNEHKLVPFIRSYFKPNIVDLGINQDQGKKGTLTDKFIYQDYDAESVVVDFKLSESGSQATLNALYSDANGEYQKRLNYSLEKLQLEKEAANAAGGSGTGTALN